VFLNFEGILHVDYTPHKIMITGDAYAVVLRNLNRPPRENEKKEYVSNKNNPYHKGLWL